MMLRYAATFVLCINVCGAGLTLAGEPGATRDTGRTGGGAAADEGKATETGGDEHSPEIVPKGPWVIIQRKDGSLLVGTFISCDEDGYTVFVREHGEVSVKCGDVEKLSFRSPADRRRRPMGRQGEKGSWGEKLGLQLRRMRETQSRLELLRRRGQLPQHVKRLQRQLAQSTDSKRAGEIIGEILAARRMLGQLTSEPETEREVDTLTSSIRDRETREGVEGNIKLLKFLGSIGTSLRERRQPRRSWKDE